MLSLKLKKHRVSSDDRVIYLGSILNRILKVWNRLNLLNLKVRWLWGIIFICLNWQPLGVRVESGELRAKLLSWDKALVVRNKC